MKIERAWLRIIVSVIAGGFVGFACQMVVINVITAVVTGRLGYSYLMLGASVYLIAPLAAAVLVHALTPREKKDGHTRCGKCGYILKGLTEPRCSECGERI